MLKQNWRLISRLERIGDNLIIVAAFFAAYFGRDSLIFWNEILDLSLPFTGEQLAPINEYVLVLLIGLIGYAVMLNLMGAYGSMRLSSVWRLFRIALEWRWGIPHFGGGALSAQTRCQPLVPWTLYRYQFVRAHPRALLRF